MTRALREKGKDVRFIYSWDDYDVFRKVPKNMPEPEFLEKYLRYPITLVPDTTEYKFFKEKYGSTDVNSILEKLVNESELNNEKIDLKDWFPIPMYMPQKLAQKYVKELQSEKQ